MVAVGVGVIQAKYEFGVRVRTRNREPCSGERWARRGERAPPSFPKLTSIETQCQSCRSCLWTFKNIAAEHMAWSSYSPTPPHYSAGAVVEKSRITRSQSVSRFQMQLLSLGSILHCVACLNERELISVKLNARFGREVLLSLQDRNRQHRSRG